MATHSPVEGRRLPLDETDAWVDGSIAGIFGAAVVALFFLAVDLAEGVPLRTPGLLGTALFLGRSLPPDAAPSMAVVNMGLAMNPVAGSPIIARVVRAS